MSKLPRDTTTRDRHRSAIARGRPPCGICGEAIDYGLRSPDPGSFEVDHIIPLDKGGLDTLENKQAAHRVCNRAKWNTVTTNEALTWATSRRWW